MVAQFLAQHAGMRALVPLNVTQIVSLYEVAWLQMFEGWRPYGPIIGVVQCQLRRSLARIA